jgi:prepilin-type N-terminal cleavage/methylation domain-containing protein
MNYVSSKIPSNKGFTLVEIIATIIVMGILAAFFIHFMGIAVDYSWKSVELVAGEAAAEGKLEEIIAYYTSKINDDLGLDNALSLVKSEYGGDTTIYYIEFDSGGNEYVPTSGTSNNLKVTVEASGQNLSTILTKSRTESTDPKVSY